MSDFTPTADEIIVSRVTDIENRLDNFRQLASSTNILEVQQALFDAAQLVEEMLNECQSLWLLLDELKASEIENHSVALREEISDIVDRIQKLSQTNVEEA